MKAKNLLLATLLLLPLALFAQERGFTVSGFVGNGVGAAPDARVALRDSSWDELYETRTGVDGTFTLRNVAKGNYTLETGGGPYEMTRRELRIHSDLLLDTLLVEAYLLEPNIWYLQKTVPNPAPDPLRQQYIDFRRAIDSLPLTYLVKEHKYNVDTVPDASSVLASLRGVTVEEGWLLDICYEGTWGGGAVKLYTRRTDEPKRPDREEFPTADTCLMPHLLVEFTPEGIWSAYQLVNSHCYMPKVWHAHYDDHSCIFTLDEVRRRSPAMRDSLAAMPEIHTSVKILDADHAVITAYWWNDWVGLFEETVFVERAGSSVRIILPTRENTDPRVRQRIIAPYDCGVDY